MGTPLQTNKHEAVSPLGCLCHPPFSFWWQPSAPASSQAKQTCSCCWQTWRQTCCCQTWRATWRTSKQQRTRPGSGQQSRKCCQCSWWSLWKIVRLDMHLGLDLDMHLESRTENLDPGRQDVIWPLLSFPAQQNHIQTYHVKYTNLGLH